MSCRWMVLARFISAILYSSGPSLPPPVDPPVGSSVEAVLGEPSPRQAGVPWTMGHGPWPMDGRFVVWQGPRALLPNKL
ncbi:hypothetical protein CEP54_003196 [Fusarium duplospermum]|uniref:Secreted protein n=1 Tax=Fusarium duplospermum TaxID=1325734 RepID=A0A428QQE6_9HYPO|nr:hypothetical protein CEP54_003196 [Fusarium duplospermum]